MGPMALGASFMPGVKETPQPPRWSWDVLCRGVWASLALIHAFPLAIVLGKLATSPSFSHAGSAVALVAVTAFFVAKTADVAWLRSDRPRLELALWFLIAALVHPPAGAAEKPDALLVAPTVAVLALAVRRDPWRPRFRRPSFGYPRFGQPVPAPVVLTPCVRRDLPAAASTASLSDHVFCRRGLISIPPPRWA